MLRRAEPDDRPTFRLTKRDCDLVQAVWHYRALTAPQLAALFFSSSTPKTGEVNARCKHRLRMLFYHGYLIRNEQSSKLSEGRKPLIYSLDRKGAELLSEMQGAPIDWDPKDHAVSPLFLEHLLATNNVRVAIVLSAQQHGWGLAKWLDDKTLKSPRQKETVTLIGPRGSTEPVAVVPDGYFVIEAGEFVYHHFLEIDRGTETGQASEWGRHDWARKMRAYLEYYQSGSYMVRYQTQSLRILTVTTGERRLAHLKTITHKVGGLAQFWFTTQELATTHDVLSEPIWQMADQDGMHSLIW